MLIRKYNHSNIGSGNSRHIGLGVISFALFVEVIGQNTSILTFQFFAIYIFILGCSFYFINKNFVYKNLALYIYLLLAIPLPSFLLDQMTFNLKLAAASISGFLLSFIYPSTSLYGSTLNINNFFIEVTPGCSGMENIFGMVSLLWLFALFQKRRLIAYLDYLISVPAAILANIIRIVTVSILTVNGYGKFALENFHEVIGIVIFIIIIFLISIFNEWPDLKSANDDKKFQKPVFSENNTKIFPVIIIMLLITTGSIILQLRNKTIKNEKYPLVINSIKKETPDWKSRDEVLEDSYYSMLKTNDILMREYYKKNDTSGEYSVYLYFVHARGDRTPFLHRPELCLTGEGYNLLEKNIITLPFIGKKVTRMLFVRNKKGLLVYYWYRYNGTDLNSYLNLQISMLADILGRSVCSMIRLSRIVDPENVEKGEILLREFADIETPQILPDLIYR